MTITLTLFLIALLTFLALKAVCSATKGHSCAGHRTLSKISGWQSRRRDVWASPQMKKLTALTARAVLMDEATAARLRKSLAKAGLSMTPQEYTARKYLIVAAGAALAALCCCLNFLFGAFVAVLGMIFALMKQRDTLDVKIRKKERMTEFTAKTVDRTKKPSVLTRLQQFKELVKANTIDRVSHKEQERTR